MRYDLSQPILDLQGHPLPSEETPGSAPLTLGMVLFRSALFVEAGQNPPGEEKFKAGKLAEKIASAGSSVDLTTDEMARLRAAVGRMYMPTLVFRVWTLIDAHSAGADPVN